MSQNKTQPSHAKPPGKGSDRLVSLDVFRGATIAAMMLVNNPGSWDAVYQQLDHAEWNGWTFTDIIFPFFLWIAGVAIPLSASRRLERGDSRSKMFFRAARRSVLLFALGLSLAFFSFTINGSYHKDGSTGAWLGDVAAHIRIFGVLQRIAVCYLLASGIFLAAKWRAQIGWLIALLAGYWLLMKCAPVPAGHAPWTLTPEGNFSAYVDGKILGLHNYLGKSWDPEGIVSTIPAIATCLFGMLTGELLLAKRSAEQKTAWLFVAGNGLMLTGAVMNIWLPINKNLWTSSYSVFMAGLAMNVFAVFYWLVDVKGHRRWTKPLAIYGMNAITVFMLSGILGRISLAWKVPAVSGNPISLKEHLFETYFHAPLAHLGVGPKICSLSWAITYVMGLFLVAYLMFRRKWVLKI